MRIADHELHEVFALLQVVIGHLYEIQVDIFEVLLQRGGLVHSFINETAEYALECDVVVRDLNFFVLLYYLWILKTILGEEDVLQDVLLI